MKDGNRLSRSLLELRAQGRRALIPYFMAGDPDPRTTGVLVDAVVAAGADAVELGVPFSDPIADGPVNQRAGLRAMRHGMNVSRALDIVAGLRARSEVPFVFMTYYNLILHYGLQLFCRDAAGAGLDGVIVADLPPEEGAALIAEAGAAGLATVFLLAPTSTDERIKAVAAASTGFVYCVSLTGVTGIRDELPAGVRDLIVRIKRQTATPVCVGFGISRPEQARMLRDVVDGIIVGSAIVKMIEESPQAPDRVGAFVRNLRRAIDQR